MCSSDLDAGIPHLRLLPYLSPLTALSVYFDRFSTPSPRARRLLTRWLWRGNVTGELRGDGRGMRPALEAVRSATDSEVAARNVLMTVATTRPAWSPGTAFNLRHARSRLSVIALVDLRPRDLRTGEPLDIAALLNSEGDPAPQIVGHRPTTVSDEEAAVYSSIGNRILYPPSRQESVLSLLLAASSSQPELPYAGIGLSPHALASHAISGESLAALRNGDRVAFLNIRRADIEAATVRLVDRHAEWEHSDRLSIAALTSEDD